MLRSLSAKQVLEWMEFYRREPFGRDADDVGLAMVAMYVAAQSGGKGRLRLKDFMPHANNEASSINEMEAQLRKHG